MELTKLKPWNWFKHEEQPASSGVPVRRSSSNPDPVSQLHQEIDRKTFTAWNGLTDHSGACYLYRKMLLPMVLRQISKMVC